MQTNNHRIVDYDAVLDSVFGPQGTLSRTQAEEDAYNFIPDNSCSTHGAKRK